MSTKYSNQDQNEGGNEKMVLRSVFVEPSVWNMAKAKAKRNRVPLAVIVRKLILAWVNGQISVTIDEE